VRATTEPSRHAQRAARAAAALGLAALAAFGALAQEDSAPPKPTRGRLTVSFAEYMECAVDNSFVRGESVMLSGGSFLPSESVAVTLVGDAGEAQVATVRANPRGGLSAIAAIPADAPLEGDVRLVATAAKGDAGGGVILRSPPLRFVAERRDSDGDGFLDHCDSCPALASELQDDSDADGLGDPCDKCPNDSDNDSDGDGMCADVDPNPYAPDASS
jgi:hypothetical protein